MARAEVSSTAATRTRGSSRPTRSWSGSVYRAWHKARHAALTEQQVATLLARRPYDLRHACVSTWLNAGAPPAQVAEWAGHSVEVLLRVYAKCVDGDHQAALRRIEDATSQ